MWYIHTYNLKIIINATTNIEKYQRYIIKKRSSFSAICTIYYISVIQKYSKEFTPNY